MKTMLKLINSGGTIRVVNQTNAIICEVARENPETAGNAVYRMAQMVKAWNAQYSGENHQDNFTEISEEIKNLSL